MNATTTTTATLSNLEARGIFAAQLPSDCAARNVAVSVHERDKIVTWSCDVIESFTGDVIGVACFDEHWGEIELTWL